MKFCNLKDKQCPYVKDGRDYRDLKDSVTCAFAAMISKKVYIISKMTECPKDKEA